MGISIIEVTPPLSQTAWDTIEKFGFTVYGDIGIRFPIAGTFANPDSSLFTLIRRKTSQLLSQPSVKAIGLFTYGNIRQREFRSAAAPFITELQRTGQTKIYYTSSSRQVLPHDSLAADFVMYDIHVTPQNWTTLTVEDHPAIGAYRFLPSPKMNEYLSPFKQFLEATSQTSDIPVIVNSSWLLSMAESHSQFKNTIRSVSSTADPIFPVPRESIPQSRQSPIPVILLIMTWASVALHYNISPLYRKSLFRYFTAHKFFIDDIFHRHIRSASPAMILLFQNAVLIAAGVYAFVATFFSSQGLDVLFHYFPTSSIFGTASSGFAVWAFSVSLILSFISITWLYISHKNINSFTQIATIYAWPLHINLGISTVGIAVFASGGAPFLIASFVLLTIPIQLISFIISSFDAAKFIQSRLLLYMLSTSVLYLAVLVALLIWGSTTERWRDALQLALTL